MRIMATLLQQERAPADIMHILASEELQKMQQAFAKSKPNDPCPCGSGKKVKFCCSADIVDDLARVVRMMEGDQRAAALDTVEKLLAKALKLPKSAVRVVTGEVFDVAVDIRRGSPYFGQWVGVTLSAENRLQLYVPPGFAHGFCTLSERADFLYKCTDFYAPGDEYGIAWDDPEIDIDWPAMDYLLSDKDRDNPRLAESRSLPGYQAD